MPQNVATEMLLVTSDDYWGHAGDFDSAVNFYPYSFIVTPEQYSGMDDADKSRFYPCALFYYMGETDNHGYRPQRIGTRVEDSGEVTMGRVLGLDRLANQEIRTYIRGERTGYSIPGSYTMLNGVGESYEAISTAAEAGDLSPGTFGVGDLLYNQDEVISTINTTAGIETEESSAENYAAEEATPSSYNDVNPEDYVATPEATPEGYEVADTGADVENYFEAEGFNFNHTVGDFTQDSAAGSGYGVPEYYGSNSKGPMVMEAEVIYGTDGSVLGQAVGNWDSTPMGYQAEEFNAYSDPISDRQIWKIKDLGGDVDESMTRSQASDYIKDLMGRESGTWRAEGLGDYTGPLTDGFGENSASVSNQGVPVWYGSAEEAYNGMGENSASISGQGVPQWYGSAEELPTGVGMPAIDDGFYPNSYGEDSSTFGQGVPQWYGSAETMEAQEFGQVESNRYTKMALLVAGVVSGFLVAKRFSDAASEEPEEPEEEPETTE